MSQYFKAKAVRAKGRLIALLDNGAYEKAVDVTDPEEFALFYALDCSGHYLKFLVYVLPEESVAECL